MTNIKNTKLDLEYGYIEAIYSKNKIEIYDKDGLGGVYVTKLDLINMLKLFEDQEQED